MKRTAAEYAVLSKLLDEALELPIAGRAAWIDALGAEYLELKPTLVRLLLSEPAADTVDLPEVARHVDAVLRGAATMSESLALKAGSRIDSYELIRELGRGGMGAVWLARRVEGLTRRLVALKLPHPGLFHAELAERIARERDILEGLAHPNIARLYDAGVTAAGQPYLALEYIEGVPITTHCDARQLTIRARIELFRQVLEALQFAHAHLVIHRDLKPANIMVTDAGKVVLLDFGIAKLLTEGVTAETALTRLSGRALTLDYASPEQIAGQPLTTASDVYSLGVVLYELLCGERPYRLTHDSAAALEQAILKADIRTPSHLDVAPETASRRSATPRKLKRTLDGDLDTILLKAIRTASADRYHSVDALAEDLDRYLSGDAVHARRESLWYRTRKFVARYRTAVAAVGVVVIALTVGTAVALWQAQHARDEARRAEAVQNFLISIFQANTRNQSDPIKARGKTARELLADGEARLARDTSLPAPSRIKLLGVIATLYNEMQLYDEAAALQGQRVALLRVAGKSAQPELAEALTGYAANLLQTSHPAGALAALREAETLLAARGELDTWTAGHTYSYLALALNYTDGAAAVRYAEQAARILARVDPDSEVRLGALWMVADGKRATDPAAAESASRDAMEVARKLYGRGAPIYGDSALFLADIQSDLLKREAAERNFRIAEALSAYAADADDHLVMQTGLRYGKFLVDNGDLAEGQARIDKTLARAIAVHGKDDLIYTAWAREYSALAWWRRGLLPQALEQARGALEIYLPHGVDDRAAKAAELNCDLLLLTGDVAGASRALQIAHEARGRTGTALESGFREGLMLRDADVALASGEAARAQTLFAQVAGATMPSTLRFRRYHLDAGIGIANAEIAQGDLAGGVRAADSVVREIHALGDPIVFADRQAGALLERGRAYAGQGECVKANADWDAAGRLMQPTEDAAGYRRAALVQARHACTTSDVSR